MPTFEEITKSEYNKLWRITYKDKFKTDSSNSLCIKHITLSYDINDVLMCKKEEHIIRMYDTINNKYEYHYYKVQGN